MEQNKIKENHECCIYCKNGKCTLMGNINVESINGKCYAKVLKQ